MPSKLIQIFLYLFTGHGIEREIIKKWLKILSVGWNMKDNNIGIIACLCVYVQSREWGTSLRLNYSNAISQPRDIFVIILIAVVVVVMVAAVIAWIVVVVVVVVATIVIMVTVGKMSHLFAWFPTPDWVKDDNQIDVDEHWDSFRTQSVHIWTFGLSNSINSKNLYGPWAYLYWDTRRVHVFGLISSYGCHKAMHGGGQSIDSLTFENCFHTNDFVDSYLLNCSPMSASWYFLKELPYRKMKYHGRKQSGHYGNNKKKYSLKWVLEKSKHFDRFCYNITYSTIFTSHTKNCWDFDVLGNSRQGVKTPDVSRICLWTISWNKEYLMGITPNWKKISLLEK